MRLCLHGEQKPRVSFRELVRCFHACLPLFVCMCLHEYTSARELCAVLHPSSLTVCRSLVVLAMWKETWFSSYWFIE